MIDCVAEIASAAPDLPFYYYHIPALTGVDLNMVDFLTRAGDVIPNLVGLKYTSSLLHEFQACLGVDEGRFEVMWGCDEMLLGAIATGAKAAIGSTFNIAAPIYTELMTAFDAGDLETARRLQNWSVTLVRTIARQPFHPAMKAILGFLGLTVGNCRLPLPKLTGAQVASLRSDLDSIGFFEQISKVEQPVEAV